MSVLLSHAFGHFLANQLVLLSFGISLILSSVSALEVVPDSNCAAICSNQSSPPNTTTDDITCQDQDYNTSAAGRAFKDCVTCELRSPAFDDRTNQTDLGWALYNLRYSAAWCIFGYPELQIQQSLTPCNRTCGNVATAIQTNLLTPNESTPYDYCEDPLFTYNALACASCYAKVPNQQLISNFLNTLQTACHSQPPPTGYLPIDPAQVFTLTPSISDPTASTTTTTTTGAQATANPSSPSGEASGLSWNAKVAISISVPVAALLIFSLLCLLLYVHRQTRHRRRSRKGGLAKSSSHRTHRQNTKPSFKYPIFHKTHRKTHSDESAVSEKQRVQQEWTFNRPYTYPKSIRSYNINSQYPNPNNNNNDIDIQYPAPLRTHTTITPSPGGLSKHTRSPSQHLTTPRSHLPSYITTTRPATASPPQTATATSTTLSPNTTTTTTNPNRASLSGRPPPPPPGLLQWEQRGIQHARSKSLRKSGENQFLGRNSGERVKVAMQVPRDANISEWKEETRTPTPVTEEAGSEEKKDGGDAGGARGGGGEEGIQERRRRVLDGAVREQEEKRERERERRDKLKEWGVR